MQYLVAVKLQYLKLLQKCDLRRDSLNVVGSGIENFYVDQLLAKAWLYFGESVSSNEELF